MFSDVWMPGSERAPTFNIEMFGKIPRLCRSKPLVFHFTSYDSQTWSFYLLYGAISMELLISQVKKKRKEKVWKGLLSYRSVMSLPSSSAYFHCSFADRFLNILWMILYLSHVSRSTNFSSLLLLHWSHSILVQAGAEFFSWSHMVWRWWHLVSSSCNTNSVWSEGQSNSTKRDMRVFCRLIPS